MAMRLLTRGLVALFLCPLLACGDDGDGGAASVSAGGAGGVGGAAGAGGAVAGAGGSAGTGGAASGLPCAVEKVLASQCQSCHGAAIQYGAPMPLVTWDDLQAPAKSDASKKVYELVGTRIHDDKKPMPQPPAPRLDATDLATVDAWIAAGAPRSDEGCQGGSGQGGGGGAAGGPSSTLSCTPDLMLRAPAPFAMPKDQADLYVCYGVDVTRPEGAQAIAMVPRVDNKAIVHHVLLFQSENSYSPEPQPCEGTMVNSANKLVYGWAPGGSSLELPPDVGMPMQGTTHYMVQVHYNNLAGLEGQVDSSGFDLCTTDTPRPQEADVLAFGTVAFEIPPHGSLDTTCDFAVAPETPKLNVLAAFPHMHKLGRSIRTEVLAGGTGAPVDLGTQDPWDFNNQPWMPIKATISPGDVVRTRCVYENDTDTKVKFGENTGDEMCFSFTMYYPRLPDLKSWAAPSISSKCTKNSGEPTCNVAPEPTANKINVEIVSTDVATPPETTGGDPSGTWSVDKAVMFLPTNLVGLIDLEKSNALASGFFAFDADGYRTRVSTELTLATSLGPFNRVSDNPSKGTFTVDKDTIAFTPECGSLSEAGNGKARYTVDGDRLVAVLKVKGVQGTLDLLIEAARVP